MALPKIYLKRSSVTGKAPSANQLEYGELAINYADGHIYYKNSQNTVKKIGSDLESQINTLKTSKLDTTGTASKATSDAKGNNIASTYIANLSASGRTVTVTKGDGTQTTFTTQDTTYGAATGSALGLVKTGANITNTTGTISLTKSNVTSALGYTPPTQDTTYATMVGASSSTAGKGGLVPTPLQGKQTSFLRGDGQWAVPTNTTYGAATASVLGLVKVGANITNTSGTISLTKDNVTTALGYTPPTTNTTYAVMKGATSTANGTSGLVPVPVSGKQTSFLRGDGQWVVPTNTTYKAGDGLTLSGNTFANSGVRSVTVGSTANQLVVNTGGSTATLTINNVAHATSANTSTTATKLATPRTISLTGNVVGSVSFDGSKNVAISASLGDSITAKNLTVTTSMKLPVIVEYDTTTKVTTRTIAKNSRSGHYVELAPDAKVTIASGATWAIDC